MNLFNLFATLTLDTGDFEKKISDIENGASDLSSDLKSSFSRGKNAVDDFSDKVDDMQSDVGKNLDKTENDAEDFRREIDQEFEKSEDAVEDFSDKVGDMSSKYKKNTDGMGKNSSSFSSKFGGALKTGVSAVAGFVTAVAAAATAVAGLATQAIDFAGDLDDSATRVGLSTESYQKWAFAVKLAGADASALETAVRGLNTFTGTLTAENEAAIASLNALGISYEDFVDMPIEEKLEAVVEGLQGMEDQTEMVQIAQDLLGSRAYQQLMPLLTQEKGYVDELGESMKETGMIMSDEAVKAGAALGDQLDTLKQRFTIVSNTMLSEFFPQIQLILEGLNGLTTGSDDAMNALTEGIVGLINKVAEALPTILTTAVDLLLDVLLGVTEAISNPDIINAIMTLLEQLLFSIIEVLPTLVGSLFDVAAALIDGLLHVDWASLIVELLIVLIEIVSVQLPQLLIDAMLSVLDVFMGMFTKEGAEKFKRLGLDLAEAWVNGMISQAETGLNLLIDLINGMTGTLSKAWTWIAGEDSAIPKIPHVNFGRVDFAEGGMFPEDEGTLYALAGEEGAEIVARGSRGTGVANIEQIADAQYMAMQDYDLRGAIQQAAAAIVNGIVAGLSRTGDNSGRTPVIFRIGDKDFIGYIETALDNSLQSQGRKTIRNVTAYGTRG